MSPSDEVLVAQMAACLKSPNQSNEAAADDAKALLEAIRARNAGLWSYSPPKQCPRCGSEQIRPGVHAYSCGSCGHSDNNQAEYPKARKVASR